MTFYMQHFESLLPVIRCTYRVKHFAVIREVTFTGRKSKRIRHMLRDPGLFLAEFNGFFLRKHMYSQLNDVL
jgi:hypothetical protein